MIKFEADFSKFARDFKKQINNIAEEEQIRFDAEYQYEVNGMVILEPMVEEAFKIILDQYDGNSSNKVRGNISLFPEYMHGSIRDIFNKLKYSTIIASSIITLDTWETYLTPNGKTYFKDKEEYEKKIKDNNKEGYFINAQNSNIFLGDITNSSIAININNIIQHINNEIEQKGGDDKEELKAILEDAKSFIEEIKTTKQITDNKGLSQKISKHLEKHSWFYSSIVNLIGSVVINLI